MASMTNDLDAANLFAEELRNRVNAVILKHRDQPIDLDELELMVYALGESLNKAHGLLATIVVHPNGMSRDSMHIMELMRLHLGYFQILVREAKDSLNGKA